MKKLIVLVAIAAAISLAACGPSTDDTPDVTDVGATTEATEPSALEPESITPSPTVAVPRADFATGLVNPDVLVGLSDGRVSELTGGTRVDFATGLDGPQDLIELSDGRVLTAEYGAGRVSVIAARSAASAE